MDSRIEKILATDKEAREQIAKAKELAENVKAEIETETDKLKKKAAEQYEKEVKEVLLKEKEKTETFCNEGTQKDNVICENLQKKYEENKDKWVEEIFNKVISE